MTDATPEPIAGDDVPLFSERLSALLEAMFKGQAPNSGHFCGHCYSPLGGQRLKCPHCGQPVAKYPPVKQVPREILLMFRKLRRRESLVVNSFAFAGLLLSVVIFIAVFSILFFTGANVWWYVGDIALLFVLARVLAGLIGGFWGDDVGYRYARRKLAEDWSAFEEARSRLTSR